MTTKRTAKPRMRRWDASIIATASRFLGVVDAATEEEALAKAHVLAQTDDGASLCHQCSSAMDLGDFDDVSVFPYSEEE